ncbi:hypothetical protein QCA50_011589 [Cerrena zonata]|uniref:DUF6533 domain-containing protein n=1 Tax=Cerrena zonata TaxID=2478898 RepID=A0AAW0FWE6_9APHY
MSSQHPPTANGLYNIDVCRYVHIATASAWLWDALVSFSTEVDAFMGRRLALVDIVYWLSRILTLLTVILEIVAVVKPSSVARCNQFVHIISGAGTIVTCLCTFLLLVRAKGVFSHSQRARYVFNTSWLILVAGIIATVPFAFFGSSDNITGYCIITRIDKTEIIAPVTVAVFDTAVFISISYRILSIHSVTRTRWITFFIGREAGSISRALLRAGILHFVSCLIVLLCLMIVGFSYSIPADLLFQWRVAVYLASATFYNTVACRMFRSLRQVVPGITFTSTIQMSELRA